MYKQLKEKLPAELFTQVLDALGDNFDFDVVPRARLNKVIAERNALREQQPAPATTPATDTDDTPPTAPSTGAKPPKETPVDVAALKKQFDAEKEQAIAAVKLQYTALDALKSAGAIDAELIWNGMEKPESAEKLTEWVDNLKATKGHLFGAAGGQPAGGTGKAGGTDPLAAVSKLDDFMKLSMDDQIKFKNNHPQKFAEFVSAHTIY